MKNSTTLIDSLANAARTFYVPPGTPKASFSFYFVERGNCKSFSVKQFPKQRPAEVIAMVKTMPIVRSTSIVVKAPSKRLLTIHGNVLYDVNYRSNIDTPYAQKDVYQHTVQTYLDITWKNKYPFRLFVTNRFGNSPFFKSYSDVNLQFDRQQFVNKIKQLLIAQIVPNFNLDSLQALKAKLEAKRLQYDHLQSSVRNPAILQKLVESREQELIKMPQLPADSSIRRQLAERPTYTRLLQRAGQKFSMQQMADSLSNNQRIDSIKSALNGYAASFEQQKKKLDSVSLQLKKLDSAYNIMRLLQHADIAELRKAIEETHTVRDLQDKIKEMKIADSVLPKGYKTLFALKSFGIGRSIADYSELSAKNVSITGIQAEYNPRYYYAVAAGTVDYRFRDYVISRNGQPKQWLALVRAGKGYKNGNHIIATYYTGRRQLYNSVSNNQANSIPNYHLMGFTIEGRYNLNHTTYLTAEVAKSSLPYFSGDSTKGRNLIGNIVKTNDRSNEAWAATMTSFIPATGTTISGSYRHTGANFQSFSLFTTGPAQRAWSIKGEQPFFKRKLTIVAAIRENDFVNSFTGLPYSSNTVLKTLQATMRIRKWPVVSVGYFPSSQLTKLGDGNFSENLFYTLTGSANHFYKWRGIQFNSTLVYTQFYNRSSDSGFVYFNTKNMLFSQGAFLGKVNLQSNFSVAANSFYTLYVLEQNADVSINKWLSVGGGTKYNRQTVVRLTQWGYSANAKMKIPLVGEIQLIADKGFLPGQNRQLVDNNVARLTYFKTF